MGLVLAMSEAGPAIFSPDRRYRYVLRRDVLGPLDPTPHRGTVNWLMLNSSTGNEAQLDPTLRRDVHFTRAWGYGRMAVTNLFAFASPDPKSLLRVDDPVGPENDRYIVEEAKAAALVVVGWGNSGGPGTLGRLIRERARYVAELLAREGIALHALAANGDGSPAHPLYLRADLEPIDWPGRGTQCAA